MKLLWCIVISACLWHGLAGAFKCERIQISMCQELGYNLTSMPNFVGHEDQQQAERALLAFVPLVHYNCSRHLRFFLCSVFAPLCSEHVIGAIPSCRSLCEEVEADCHPIMKEFNFDWPPEFNCSRFPVPENNGLCMRFNNSSKVQQSFSSIQPTVEYPKTRPQLCPPNFSYARDYNSIICAPKCGRDAYYKKEDKLFAERWITRMAIVCFVSTLFTLMTFSIEPVPFYYPEKPMVFLALCYNIMSQIYILRGVLGSEFFTCVPANNEYESYLAVDGLENPYCTFFFLFVYYLNLSASIWWVVLAISWYLSAAKQWTNEAISNLSSYFHIVAWTVPGIFSVLTSAYHQVSADELTGFCHVNEEASLGLVIIPHGVLLVLGFLLATRAALALIEVRRELKLSRSWTAKMERLMFRLTVFIILYVIPVIGVIIFTLIESWYRPNWRSLALSSALNCRLTFGCGPGPTYESAAIELTMGREFCLLMVGVSCGVWVWSSKTCRLWSSLFSAPRKTRHNYRQQPITIL